MVTLGERQLWNLSENVCEALEIAAIETRESWIVSVKEKGLFLWHAASDTWAFFLKIEFLYVEFYVNLNGLGMSVIIGRNKTTGLVLENSCEGFAFFSVCKMVTESLTLIRLWWPPCRCRTLLGLSECKDPQATK